MATVAELLAVLRADTRQFSAAMTTAGAQTKSLEGSSKMLGKVGAAAMLGVGLAAAKAVTDFVAFEQTMMRTVTLAGSSQEEMKRLSDEVLNLSGEVGKGPQELAEALYFTESAGIAAADAMGVVESAAKASALGLGETEVVADAVTSVLNAYGQENINAAEATDVLVAAVREGKGEADAIAGAIGRIIPIASEMGVEFDEVAANIAAMTRTGLDANEAVTALRGILTGLLDPTTQTRDLLNEVGSSAEAVQSSIESNGLLTTLSDLMAKFDGNTEAMAKIFPNVRAFAGAMSLLGANSDEVRGVLERVTNSGGTTEEMFALLADTASFKLSQAFAKVKVALIEVGGAAAPVVTAFAGLVAFVAPALPVVLGLGLALGTWAIAAKIPTWFAAAEAAVGLLTVKATAAAAAVQAFAIRANLAGGVLPALVDGIKKFTAGLTAAQAAAGAWTVALTLVAVAAMKVKGLFDQVGEQARTVADDVLAGNSSLAEWVEETNNLEGSHTGLMAVLNGNASTMASVAEGYEIVTATIKDQNSEILGTGPVYDRWAATLNNVTNANKLQHEALAELVAELEASGTVINDATRAQIDQAVAAGDLETAIEILGVATGKTEREITILGQAHEYAAEEAQAQFEAEARLAGGQLGLVQLLKDLNEQERELARMRANGKQGTAAYDDAVLTALATQEQFNQALRDYKADLDASNLTQQQAMRKVMALGREFGLTATDVRSALDPLREVRTELERVNRLPKTMEFDVNVSTRYRVHGLPPAAYEVDHAGGLVGRRFHKGGWVGNEVPAVLQRGEFVIRRAAVKALGEPFFEALNAVPMRAAGGAITRSESISNGLLGRTEGSGGGEVKVLVRPDRRRFGRDLDFDHLTRGL